jgi:hypothetical protein
MALDFLVNFVETKDRLEAVVGRSIIPSTVFEGELLCAGHRTGAECSAALRITSRSTREVSMPTLASAGHGVGVGDPLDRLRREKRKQLNKTEAEPTSVARQGVVGRRKLSPTGTCLCSIACFGVFKSSRSNSLRSVGVRGAVMPVHAGRRKQVENCAAHHFLLTLGSEGQARLLDVDRGYAMIEGETISS